MFHNQLARNITHQKTIDILVAHMLHLFVLVETKGYELELVLYVKLIDYVKR